MTTVLCIFWFWVTVMVVTGDEGGGGGGRRERERSTNGRPSKGGVGRTARMRRRRGGLERVKGLKRRVCEITKIPYHIRVCTRVAKLMSFNLGIYPFGVIIQAFNANITIFDFLTSALGTSVNMTLKIRVKLCLFPLPYLGEFWCSPP
ncbi:transmembrane protein, putative [Medicago truncatula]|uniref:Transmembrane protein, putative n=1 Tax=Medicago truncatula TaxID=3880 RepID=G7I8F8_MEDTR|nr:transmembrane protein, putative [Medicago truncatula]